VEAQSKHARSGLVREAQASLAFAAAALLTGAVAAPALAQVAPANAAQSQGEQVLGREQIDELLAAPERVTFIDVRRPETGHDRQRVALPVLDRHLRHDADSHAELNIALDHLGIGGGEADVGVQAEAVERRVDVRSFCTSARMYRSC
jgi:hypothetical protein